MLAAVVLFCLLSLSEAENIDFIKDPGVYGPPLETVHAYYSQWPTGNSLGIWMTMLQKMS